MNINEEGFGGVFNYMLFQDGERLWHGDLESYIDRGVISVTIKGDKEDFSVVRCIRVF